jgi:hypothetical protein
VIVDDYRLITACQEAVRDFFRDRRIDPPLHDIEMIGSTSARNEARSATALSTAC